MPSIGAPTLVSQFCLFAEDGLGAHFLRFCRSSLRVPQRQEGEGSGGSAGWGSWWGCQARPSCDGGLGGGEQRLHWRADRPWDAPLTYAWI